MPKKNCQKNCQKYPQNTVKMPQPRNVSTCVLGGFQEARDPDSPSSSFNPNPQEDPIPENASCVKDPRPTSELQTTNTKIMEGQISQKVE